MQVLNAAPGPRAILSIGLKLRAGEVGTVDDETWKTVRQRKVVAHWLEKGELRELSAHQANEAVKQGAKVVTPKSPEPVAPVDKKAAEKAKKAEEEASKKVADEAAKAKA